MIRIIIQMGYLFLSVYLGYTLFWFVSAIIRGAIPPAVRPAGVEAFLPIAGMMGLREWVVSGRLNSVHPAATVIFLLVILVSFLFRRAFCSWICPVGTISEFLWKRGFTIFKRNLKAPKWLDMILRSIKYLLLAFFVMSVFSMPLSALSSFINSDYAKLADVRMLYFFTNLSFFGMTVILFLTLVSILFRNPFCRYICPYGALTGLFGWFSPVAVTRNRSHCVSCGVCSQVCPSSLPVMTNIRTNSPECIGCWRCVSNCRADGALDMKLWGGEVIITGVLFAALLIGIFWGGNMVAKISGKWNTGISPEEYKNLLLKK